MGSESSRSGGNIQKVIMARELEGDPAVLVAAQPTRGVDIGAAEYIHERLVQQRAAGTAIEVIERTECSIERLGLLMAGGE